MALMLGLLALWLHGSGQAITPLAPPPQGGNQIIIDSTDVFHFASFGPDSLRIRKLLGHVILRQDTAVLYCDSAYQYLDSNYIEAFGRVKIIMNHHMPDSMRRTITARHLTFDGDTKIINFWDNVVLTDKQVVLKTPRLTYYRIPDYAEYLLGGELTNKDNVLTSQKGYYYPKSEMAYFKQRVKVTNPDFVLVTDTLGYNTGTKIAFFLAPTWVNDSVNSMYTEDGFYDTERDFVLLHRNASIGDSTYTLFADTIQFDQGRDLGQSMGHVRVIQKDSSLSVFGKFAQFETKTEATFVTDSAFAIQRLEGRDTLFLFADTLATFKDTVDDKRFFMAYRNGKFITSDLQGVCDSLVYWYDDSLLHFYKKPALWSDESQITGDTIMIQLRDGTIDSMSIPTSPFIASREDTVGYNQIKGRRLHAKFLEKKLKLMWIYGNSESIYFTKDDQNEYMGMNKARCSDMKMEFKDNKPTRILFQGQPEGEFHPIHLVLFNDNTLEGFEWRGDERPSKPSWVDPVIYRAAMLNDPLRQRMNNLLMDLEEVEFEIWNLLEDSIFQPTNDPVTSIPEGGISPSTSTKDTLGTAIDTVAMDTAAVDTVAGHMGKGNVKPASAFVKLSKRELRGMNARQRHVYHRRLRAARKAERAQSKAPKAEQTFKERWKAFWKGLKEPATEAEKAKRQSDKLEHRKSRLSRKGKRMERRHARQVARAAGTPLPRKEPKAPKETNAPAPKESKANKASKALNKASEPESSVSKIEKGQMTPRELRYNRTAPKDANFNDFMRNTRKKK